MTHFGFTMALPSTAASDVHSSACFHPCMSEMSAVEGRSQALAHFSIQSLREPTMTRISLTLRDCRRCRTLLKTKSGLRFKDGA